MKVKLAVAFAILLFSGAARADSAWVYTYTGNQLIGCQCSIDGSFTTAAPISSSQIEPISVLSYSFSVAGFTFNPSDSTGVVSASTDANGNVAEWVISLDAGNYVNLITEYTGTFQTPEGLQDYASDVYGYGNGPRDEDYLESQQGSWTVADPSSMPEPSSLLLLAMGLSVLIGFSRK